MDDDDEWFFLGFLLADSPLWVLVLVIAVLVLGAVFGWWTL